MDALEAHSAKISSLDNSEHIRFLESLLKVLVFLQLACQSFVSPPQKVSLWYVHISGTQHFYRLKDLPGI